MAELLEAFDEVGKEHERMEADKFNHDATYKAGINKVREVWRGGCRGCSGCGRTSMATGTSCAVKVYRPGNASLRRTSARSSRVDQLLRRG